MYWTFSAWFQSWGLAFSKIHLIKSATRIFVRILQDLVRRNDWPKFWNYRICFDRQTIIWHPLIDVRAWLSKDDANFVWWKVGEGPGPCQVALVRLAILRRKTFKGNPRRAGYLARVNRCWQYLIPIATNYKALIWNWVFRMWIAGWKFQRNPGNFWSCIFWEIMPALPSAIQKNNWTSFEVLWWETRFVLKTI